MIAALLILALSLACSEARADIYRYLNEEGVECFTDTPTSRAAVRVMKEKAASRRKAPQRNIPPSPSPAETAPKTSSDHLASVQTCPPADLLLPVSGRITSPVGLRHDPIDGVVRDHKGVDIATPEGTPVRPVAAGIVTFSGYRSGYGNTVIVRHDDGTITLYAHNSTNLKHEGEPVDRSSTIAFSGSTGRTTGPHLHFEAWKDGVNMTASFIPGAASSHGAGPENDGIRRSIQADGTLVFSNLP
ncbi:MAG TPA: M23 family metallopeptidase [Geobacteraceae bacterium]|nr:M23 family metallopeptidase [Geobacteraceae bacterium]